jgi:hypothetical protein
MHTAERHRTEPFDGPNDQTEEVTISTFLEGFAQDLRGYVSAQRDLMFMKATHKIAVLSSKAVHSGAVIGGIGMAFLFLNVALALYIGELLGSYPLGFLLTAVLAMILVGLFHLWWTNGGRDSYLLARINDMNDDEDEIR